MKGSKRRHWRSGRGKNSGKRKKPVMTVDNVTSENDSC